MTLALVRHGRTAWNLARRMQGRSDIALDAHGRAQADAAGRLLARARWERIVTSPLARAAETGALIAPYFESIERCLDDRLTERDYGVAEGMSVSEVHERWPDADYPGAEALAQLRERAREVLDEIDRLDGDSIVVSHGTLLRVGLEALTGSTCPRILNGQVVLLEREAQGRPIARFLSG